MKRYGVTITFDVECADEDTPDDIEAYYFDLIEGWEDIYRMNVEVHKPEFEAR